MIPEIPATAPAVAVLLDPDLKWTFEGFLTYGSWAGVGVSVLGTAGSARFEIPRYRGEHKAQGWMTCMFERYWWHWGSSCSPVRFRLRRSPRMKPRPRLETRSTTRSGRMGLLSGSSVPRGSGFLPVEGNYGFLSGRLSTLLLPALETHPPALPVLAFCGTGLLLYKSIILT